jgi:UDPglucose 6-dehydrogenase
MGSRMEFQSDPYEAAKGCDALFLCTEWQEYRVPDFERLASAMRQRVVFDGRNVIDGKTALAAGFEVEGIGRGTRFVPESTARRARR